MSLKDCIRSARDAGHITKEEAAELIKRHDSLARTIKSKGELKERLTAEVAAEAQERRRRALLTETAREARVNDLYAYRDAAGKMDPAAALPLILEHQGEASFADVKNSATAIVGMAQAEMEQGLHDFRKGAISGDKRRARGEVAASLDNIAREAFGINTGDAKAAGFYKVWAGIAEDLRQRFNAAGGAIGKLADWGLPQIHDAEPMLKAGLQSWVDFITPLLDAKRMKHPFTGHDMTPDDLKASLEHVWETVVTDGQNTADPNGAQGRGALFRQHADHRFLVFKDGDAWLKYQKRFGGGDVFATMMGHVTVMARDIALMERLGPNPDVVFEHLKAVVRQAAGTRDAVEVIRAEQRAKLDSLYREGGYGDVGGGLRRRINELHGELDEIRRAGTRFPRNPSDPLLPGTREKMAPLWEELDRVRQALDEANRAENIPAETLHKINRLLAEMRDPVIFKDVRNPRDYAAGQIKTAEAMMDHIKGSTNVPVNGFWAATIAGARNMIGGASLGGAPITALGDLATTAMARSFSGLPVTGTIGDVVKQFSVANRREAVGAGLLLDSAMNILHQQARYVGGLSGPDWTRFIADRVHTFSGLTPWTQAEKHAFGMAIQHELGARTDLEFGKLPEPMQRLLTRHGFDALAWDRMRAAELHAPKEGVPFLRPKEIATAAGRDLAERYLAMIYRETKFAVPESTVRSSVAIVGETQPGTVQGELLRSMGQFKSFGVALVMMQAGRIAREIQGGNIARGATYAGGLLIASTLMGALALQLKELAAGRDPRKMVPSNAKGAGFWGAALLQGGGLGIYGDFLFSDVNRQGGSLARTLTGPLFDRVDNLRALTIGNALQFGQQEKTNFGRELTKFIKTNTPGSTIWYARLAWERVLFDQLQHLMDPDAHAAFRRTIQNRKKDYGNEFWSAPGSGGIQRAPNLGAALGER